jgi:hypothetical protein
MANAEEIRAWQDKLKAAFARNGVVGGKFLQSARDTEARVGGTFWNKFHGHRVLTDSFLEFFGETLHNQWGLNNQIGWPQNQPNYSVCLLMYVTVFRTIRASEILSENGYLMQAYAMQRGIKEQLFVLCGVANKMEKFGALFAWRDVPLPEDRSRWDNKERLRIVAQRRKVEALLRDKIMGANSGLSKETQQELLRWEGLFNWEVHRSLLSFFLSTKMLMDGRYKRFELGPVQDDNADAMFMNRSMELNWMALRLIPLMRRADTPLNVDWTNKWTLLEESFEFMFKGFAELGKKIAPAFREMLDNKFKFEVARHYAEIPAEQQSNT